MNRKYRIALLMLSSMLSLVSFGADTTTSPPIAMSNAMQAAIAQLNNEDFFQRHKSIETIDTLLSEQILAMASVQDAEAQANLLPTLAYNEGMIRWLEQLLSLPSEQQASQMELIRIPGMLKVISRLFGTQETARVQSMRELAKFSKSRIDSLLARLISDTDRQISLAAMEIAWDRTPTPETVQALWYKAVEEGASRSQNRFARENSENFLFHGRQIVLRKEIRPLYDSDIATAILIHANAAIVSDKVSKFLTQCAAGMHDGGADRRRSFNLSLLDPSMRNAFQLAQQFKVRAAVPALYIMATEKPSMTINQEGDGGAGCSLSNRTEAAAIFLILTDQPHPAFFQKDILSPAIQKAWVTSDEHTEDKAVEGIRAWWQEHHAEYGAT